MSRCYIVGRYSNIVLPELEQTGLNCLVSNVCTYDEFEKVCNTYLKDDIFSFDAAIEFSRKNCANYRGREILEELHNRGVYK